MIRKLNNTYNLHNDSTNMIFNTKCQSIIPKTIPLTVATTIFFSENNELPSTASFKDRRYTFVAFGDKVRSAWGGKRCEARGEKIKRGREQPVCLRRPVPLRGRWNRGKRLEDRGEKIKISLSPLLVLSLNLVFSMILTKNLDAKRRNEELGRSAPEPLFSLFKPLTSPLSPQVLEGRVHDLGRWTKDGFSAFHALLGGRTTVNVSFALPPQTQAIE